MKPQPGHRKETCSHRQALWHGRVLWFQSAFQRREAVAFFASLGGSERAPSSLVWAASRSARAGGDFRGDTSYKAHSADRSTSGSCSSQSGRTTTWVKPNSAASSLHSMGLRASNTTRQVGASK